jgi:hypothetical protein
VFIKCCAEILENKSTKANLSIPKNIIWHEIVNSITIENIFLLYHTAIHISISSDHLLMHIFNISWYNVEEIYLQLYSSHTRIKIVKLKSLLGMPLLCTHTSLKKMETPACKSEDRDFMQALQCYTQYFSVTTTNEKTLV